MLYVTHEVCYLALRSQPDTWSVEGIEHRLVRLEGAHIETATIISSPFDQAAQTFLGLFSIQMLLAFRPTPQQSVSTDQPFQIKPDELIRIRKKLLSQFTEHAFNDPVILLLRASDQHVNLVSIPAAVKPSWLPEDIVEVNDRSGNNARHCMCEPRLATPAIPNDD